MAQHLCPRPGGRWGRASKRGLIAVDWKNRFPHNSQPYTSTIVFVVRKTNPKHIIDWPDLIGPDVTIITPDPKTSGNGKLSFLAKSSSATRRNAALPYYWPAFARILRRFCATFISTSGCRPTAFIRKKRKYTRRPSMPCAAPAGSLTREDKTDEKEAVYYLV